MSYIDAFLAAATVYNSAFAPAADEKLVDDMTTRWKTFSSLILDLYFIQAEILLKHPTQLLCMDLEDSPARHMAEGKKSQLECVVQGLLTVLSQRYIDGLLPKYEGRFSFSERLEKLVEESIRFQLRASFDLMQFFCKERFANIRKFATSEEASVPTDTTDDLGEEIDRTMQTTVEAIDNILSKITPLVAETTSAMPELETPLNLALKQELVSFLDWLTSSLESYCDPFSPTNEGPPSAKFVLVLALMSSKMEDPYIGNIFKLLSSHCPLLQSGVRDQQHLMQKNQKCHDSPHRSLRRPEHIPNLFSLQ